MIAIISALVVLLFAYLIRNFFVEVIEEEKPFFIIVGIFFVVYIFAAFLIGTFNPLKLVSQEVVASPNEDVVDVNEVD
jgi:hypothetical protein